MNVLEMTRKTIIVNTSFLESKKSLKKKINKLFFPMQSL